MPTRWTRMEGGATRQTLRKVAWSALTLLMFLAFLEILCRRMDGGMRESSHIQMDFDADLMWGLKSEPHLGREYRVNALGLRGDELRDDGALRILTLGDSSIYGHGVPLANVFSSVLAARIAAARPEPAVEPVIGAVPGYSTFQSRRLFERVKDTVDPDVVVIGNLWSDSFNAAISDEDWARELNAAYGAWQPLVAPLATLSEYSALARKLRSSVHGTFFPEKDKANVVGWTHLIPLDPSKPDPGPPRRVSTLPTFRVPLDDYRANLLALIEAVRAAGAKPVLLMLPHPLDAAGLPDTDQQYRATMRAVASETNTPLVDGPAWFAARPSGERRFSDDVHPNELGHAHLGDAVYETFRTDPALKAMFRL